MVERLIMPHFSMRGGGGGGGAGGWGAGVGVGGGMIGEVRM